MLSLETIILHFSLLFWRTSIIALLSLTRNGISVAVPHKKERKKKHMQRGTNNINNYLVFQ